MNRQTKERALFLVCSILFMILVLVMTLAWNVAVEQRAVAMEITTIENNYTDLQRHNEDLQKELRAAEKKIEELETLLIAAEKVVKTKDAVTASGGVDMVLLSESGFTADMLEQSFTQIGARGMKGTGKHFITAEKKYGINALALAALAYHESGGGSSALAQKKNNLFGWRAYHPDPYKNGMYFESKKACILHVAERICALYLRKGGAHYNGPTLRGMNKKYASDPRWAKKIASRMEAICDAALK